MTDKTFEKYSKPAVFMARALLTAMAISVFSLPPASAPAFGNETADSSPPLPSCVVRDGVITRRATGKPFIARGFNYVRLNEPKGGKHTTFSVGGYDAERAEEMLTAISRLGFNVTRVFVNIESDKPGSLTCGPPPGDLSKEYLANFVDFLLRARKHNVLVMPVIEFMPVAGRYEASIGDYPKKMSRINRMFLHEGHIRARQQFLIDFIREIRRRDAAALGSIFAFDLHNECAFDVKTPFDRDSGAFTAPNGKTYDLARDKGPLADDAAVYWTDKMAEAIHSEFPRAPVLVSVFTYRAVGRSGPGDFGAKKAGWQNRYPFRPAALARSAADIIDIHFYPASRDEFEEDLRSIEMDRLAPELKRAGKALICGEFGAHKKGPLVDSARAAAWIRDLAALIDSQGFQGRLFWTYDTSEQTNLHNAMENGGEIIHLLALNTD